MYGSSIQLSRSIQEQFAKRNNAVLIREKSNPIECNKVTRSSVIKLIAIIFGRNQVILVPKYHSCLIIKAG